MASHIERRKFLATLGGGAASAWPLAARAQQPAVPVIGYLNNASPESDASRLTGLRRGLSQTGYVEGRNLVIEYRWAGNQADRLPGLAADLVQLRVAVIVAPGLLSTLAAKAALIVAPQRGYDEPAILSYAITSFCPTSANGLQLTPPSASPAAGSGVRPNQCLKASRTRSIGSRSRARGSLLIFQASPSLPARRGDRCQGRIKSHLDRVVRGTV
jgi:hypothetical protein